MRRRDLELGLTYPIILAMCAIASLFLETVPELYFLGAYTLIVFIVYSIGMLTDDGE